jgi:predicted kinase
MSDKKIIETRVVSQSPLDDRDLFLVRGVSGSGKTEFVKKVAHQFDIIVAADDFMKNDKGEYQFDPTRLAECHQKCIAVVKEAMSNRKARIFVHNTLTTEWEMEPYQTLASDYGYKFHTIIKENRHDGKNDHGVDEVVLAQQKEKLMKNIRL